MAKRFELINTFRKKTENLSAVEGQPTLVVTSSDTMAATFELDGKQWAALAEFAAAQSLLLTDDDEHLDAHDSTEWVNR